MESSIFAIIAIIFWIVKMVGKVNKNKPGQTGVPGQPQRSVPTPPAAPVRRVTPEPAHPMTTSATPGSQPGDFWRNVGQSMQEALDELTDKLESDSTMSQPDMNDLSGDDHRVCLHDMSSDLSGDDERVCLHDSPEGTSMGGSLMPGAQQGGRVAPSVALKVFREAEPAAQPVAALPIMTAREMRQAVIMAEVLKRPGERRAEQARRWTAR